jgi:hypothetical protein
VGHLVNGQSPGLTKPFATVGTLEWFFFGMNVPVVPQMILPAKRFSTNITRVWPFVGMCSFMYQQIVRFGKLSVTVFADELLLWSSASHASYFHRSMSSPYSGHPLHVHLIISKMLLINCCTSNPLAHKDGMVVGGRCARCWMM